MLWVRELLSFGLQQSNLYFRITALRRSGAQSVSALVPFPVLLPSPLLPVMLVLVSQIFSIFSDRFLFLVAAAVLFGVVGGTACNFATQLKFLLGYDDALDVRIPSSATKTVLIPLKRSSRPTVLEVSSVTC